MEKQLKREQRCLSSKCEDIKKRSNKRDIAAIVNRSEYGSNFYKNLSSDLQKELPGVKSFSVTNLKYMKYFYEMYCFDINLQQVVDDSHSGLSQLSVDDFVDEKIICG